MNTVTFLKHIVHPDDGSQCVTLQTKVEMIPVPVVGTTYLFNGWNEEAEHIMYEIEPDDYTVQTKVTVPFHDEFNKTVIDYMSKGWVIDNNFTTMDLAEAGLDF